MPCDSRRPLTPSAARLAPESGFTLVEALIAIVILAVGLIAITNLFFVASASNSLGNATTTAAALGSERLDALKALPFQELQAMCAAVAPSPCGDLDGDATTLPTFSEVRSVPGTFTILTEWQLIATGGNTYFIHVRSEPVSGLTARRSRAEFTTFRTCGLAASGQACTVNGDCCSLFCNGATGICN